MIADLLLSRLDEWGLLPPALASWVGTGYLWGWGMDSGADLPELEDLATPAPASGDEVGRGGELQAAAKETARRPENGHAGRENARERQPQPLEDDGIAASKRRRPSGWLVFDRVMGVVPCEVLEAWQERDRAGQRAQQGGACSSCRPGRPPCSCKQPGIEGSGAASTGPRKRDGYPPVRRPPSKPD